MTKNYLILRIRCNRICLVAVLICLAQTPVIYSVASATLTGLGLYLDYFWGTVWYPCCRCFHFCCCCLDWKSGGLWPNLPDPRTWRYCILSHCGTFPSKSLAEIKATVGVFFYNITAVSQDNTFSLTELGTHKTVTVLRLKLVACHNTSKYCVKNSILTLVL